MVAFSDIVRTLLPYRSARFRRCSALSIAAGVARAAVLRDATITSGIGQFAIIQSVAPSVGIDVSPVNVREKEDRCGFSFSAAASTNPPETH